MDHYEVPAADPAAKMGDHRQRAFRDGVVRRFDAFGPETEALGGPCEGQ